MGRPPLPTRHLPGTVSKHEYLCPQDPLSTLPPTGPSGVPTVTVLWGQCRGL